MSIRDRMNAILQKYRLREAPPPEPEPQPGGEADPDPFDAVECPKCGCNDWEIYGRIHKRTVYRKGGYGSRKPVDRISYPLICNHCRHQWKQLVIEE